MTTNNATNATNFPPGTVAQGFTGATTLTNHGVLIGQATSPIAATSAGTAGQVLMSNGASADPSFQSLGSRKVFLATRTASTSAALDFNSIIDTTYSTYFLEFRNIIPATNNDLLSIQFSTNNGSSYLGSTSDFANLNTVSNSAGSFVSNGEAQAFVLISGQIGNARCGYSGNSTLYNLGSASLATNIIYQAAYGGGTPISGYCSGAGQCTTTSINAIRIALLIGNITSGSVSLYGVVEP